jgi:hypothetical protein
MKIPNKISYFVVSILLIIGIMFIFIPHINAYGDKQISQLEQQVEINSKQYSRDPCYWQSIPTHEMGLCPKGDYIAGICLTNRDRGCRPQTMGQDSTWVTAGGIYCCPARLLR